MSFDELAKEMDDLLKSSKRKQSDPEPVVKEEPKKVEIINENTLKKKGLFSRLFHKKEKSLDIPETSVKTIPIAPVFEKTEIIQKEIKSKKSFAPKKQLDEKEQTLNKKEKLLNELGQLLATKKKSMAKEELSLDKKKTEIIKMQDKFNKAVPVPKVGPVVDKSLEKKQKLLTKLEKVLAKKQFRLTDEEHLLLQEKEKLKLFKNELVVNERTIKLQIADMSKKTSGLSSDKKKLMKEVTALESRKYSIENAIKENAINLKDIELQIKQKGKTFGSVEKRFAKVEKLNDELKRKKVSLGNLESALTAKNKLLNVKEKELARKERLIDAGFKDSEKKSAILGKEKLAILTEIDSLVSKKKSIDRQVGEASTRLDEVKKLVVLKEKELNVETKRKEFAKLQQEIAKVKQSLDDSKLKLREQGQMVATKQIELEEKSKELVARENSFEDIWKQKESDMKIRERVFGEISSKVALLKSQKSMLDDQISKSSQDLDELKGIIRAKESDMESFERRERELQLKEKFVADVRKSKGVLNNKEIDLRKIDDLLAKKQNLLNQKEGELQRKRDVVEYELHKAEANRRVLYGEITTRQKELSDITKRRDLRHNELVESEGLFKKKELELLQTIKDLELDKELLDRKEDDIEQTLRRIEEDKVLLEQKENEILEKVALLEELDATVPKREEEIKKIRDELDAYELALVEKEKQLEKDYQKRAKELDRTKTKMEKSIDRLERKEAKISAVKELRASITQLENKLKNLDNQIIVNQSELAEDVQTMVTTKRMETDLKKREQEIEEREKELLMEEAEVETGEFKDYVEHEMLKYEKPELPKIEDAEEIYGLIDEARELMNMGRLNEARSTYSKIGSYYSHLKVIPADKKRVYYAILELKTDIELAHLA